MQRPGWIMAWVVVWSMGCGVVPVAQGVEVPSPGPTDPMPKPSDPFPGPKPNPIPMPLPAPPSPLPPNPQLGAGTPYSNGVSE